MMGKKLLILFVFLGTSYLLSGQEPEKKTPEDSAKVYKAIKKIAQKKSFSKWIYSLIFTIPETAKKSPPKRSKRNRPKAYESYEGKIIRNIEIETIDPFGYDIRDTSVHPSGFLKNTGNKLHIKTLPIAVRNLLLFRQNQPFDSLLIRESERLIRSQRYIHDVTLRPQMVKPGTDSVDIFIRVLDVWSLTPRGSLSASSLSFGFTDQNFLGTGQQFDNIFALNTNNKHIAYQTSYFIPNIKNSFISARLQYQLNDNRTFIKLIDFERPFYSTLTKWGGGISIGQLLNKDSIQFPDSIGRQIQNFLYNQQDMWLAKSWRLFSGKSVLFRTTNLFVSGRFQHTRYLESPVELYDSLHVYSAERFVYFSLGLTSRQYIEDKYIFKYGLVEDVPKGKLFSIIGGYQVKNSRGRLYLGLKASWGDYFRWGYASANIEYGRFFYKSKVEEGALFVDFNYFSDLFEIGKWKIRQFIKPQIMIGIKRLPTDKITINNAYGIPGFSAPETFGIHKILLSLQTQTYSPWNWIGFNFGPYLVYSVGMLGTSEAGFGKSRLYSLLGLGVLVKNNYLVFKTFQLSISFYPIIPGKGNNVTKYNAYRTTDFGFRDFEIAKPSTVIYQ